MHFLDVRIVVILVSIL